MNHNLEKTINGIHFLLNKDDYTQINKKRLREVVGFTRREVDNALDEYIMTVVDSLNIHRPFHQEKVSIKFKKFVDNFAEYEKKTIFDVTKELGISKSYYYKFLSLIEIR